MLKTAFRFLTYDRSNLAGILSGIVVSMVLVGLELDIFKGMITNVQGLTIQYPNYVWVINPKTQSALQLQNLDVRVGRELQSIPGVRQVYPMVFAAGSARLPKGGKLSVQIIGVAAPAFIGAARRYTPETNVNDLINEGAVIFDQSELPRLDNLAVGDYLTINDQRVYMSGLSQGLTGFGTSYVVTTLERARTLSSVNANYVNAYLVTVEGGAADKAAVMAQINREINTARAVEGTKLGGETIRYMLKNNNTVLGFLMMVVFSVIGGFAIVGVTLYASVNDRIRDYGTIKAIGGSNGLIRRLILLQGVLYAAIGFGIAFGLLSLTKIGSDDGFPAWLVGSLIGVTLFISIVSSLIAMRKITRLEPVQIFRM